MPRFRLRSDHAPIDLYHPSGNVDSFQIEPGQEIEVPGEVVTERPTPKKGDPEPAPLPDDAFIVANGGEEQAWPHAVWELADKPTAAPAPAASPVKEK